MRAERTALPITATRTGFAARLARVAAKAWRLWESRRAMRQLNHLSDWELRDIGLSREDIMQAYEGPVLDDPIRRLQEITRTRAKAEAMMRRGP
ncbi:DUF1127 domain-containing protein [Chelativorans salis]|uniref:DUF1127 domain-containing protein n=1 Tax=Chelativorans salis TaxID=2978478 RepID=A0ABT2LHD8_9HYPH|nr:DUF1127 domain-containing protein [Chelativorans sp. EGI FJ00035]MCT7373961.1 DUF1127 domain-containing protein [Chelativorans sp. EGI FJ00035]